MLTTQTCIGFTNFLSLLPFLGFSRPWFILATTDLLGHSSINIFKLPDMHIHKICNFIHRNSLEVLNKATQYLKHFFPLSSINKSIKEQCKCVPNSLPCRAGEEPLIELISLLRSLDNGILFIMCYEVPKKCSELPLDLKNLLSHCSCVDVPQAITVGALCRTGTGQGLASHLSCRWF